MGGFGWAVAAFVALHVGVSATGMRDRLIATVGVGAYRAGFALASLALLAWMIFAFGALRNDPFDPLNEFYWSPPAWARSIGHGLVLIGLLLAVSGFATRNPTTVGMEGALAREEPARGVIRVTRHPFLWGVAFWAAGHLLANGERFAPMLFGALGFMALYGTRSIDRKTAARDPEAWARFAAVTSNVPFAAIAQGRNRLALGEWALGLAAGLAVFLLLGFFHRQLFGAAAF
ncbi:MAG: NnrU family protein [Hyphomonadaceae bacterium]